MSERSDASKSAGCVMVTVIVFFAVPILVFGLCSGWTFKTYQQRQIEVLEQRLSQLEAKP